MGGRQAKREKGLGGRLVGAIGYPERQNTFDRLPARAPNRGRDSSCTLADASSDRSPCRAQFGNNQATPELILSSYELHGGHGRSTYLIPQRRSGHGAGGGSSQPWLRPTSRHSSSHCSCLLTISPFGTCDLKIVDHADWGRKQESGKLRKRRRRPLGRSFLVNRS